MCHPEKVSTVQQFERHGAQHRQVVVDQLRSHEPAFGVALHPDPSTLQQLAPMIWQLVVDVGAAVLIGGEQDHPLTIEQHIPPMNPDNLLPPCGSRHESRHIVGVGFGPCALEGIQGLHRVHVGRDGLGSRRRRELRDMPYSKEREERGRRPRVMQQHTDGGGNTRGFVETPLVEQSC